MTQKKNYYEDELPSELENDSLDDTHPTRIIGSNPFIGIMLILGAMGFTIATVWVVLTAPSPSDPAIVNNPTPTEAGLQSTPIILIAPPEIVIGNGGNTQILPTLDASIASQLLLTPVVDQFVSANGQIGRNPLEPFTIIPDRPRNEVIQYTVVQGDTIEAIAYRFGITPETIAWSNTRRIIQVLRPGDVVNIPPVDGVYIKTFGSATIAQLAEQFKLSDPYLVLDSVYNRAVVQEQALTPDSIPRNGTSLFFAGGEAEMVVWQVSIEVISGDTIQTSDTIASAPPRVDKVNFDQGYGGSCPPQEIVGGAYWVRPLDGGYVVTRGYTSYHPAIDLAAPVGTPVRAANSGRVIFSGRHSMDGYGYMIAIVHGPTITIYAHLSEYYTNCGQDVVAGQVIGAVGNTGNSSGPHLHFEIRGTRGGGTQDPASILSF